MKQGLLTGKIQSLTGLVIGIMLFCQGIPLLMAQEPVLVLDKAVEINGLGQQMSILEDVSGKLTQEDVLASSEFVRSENDAPSLGFTTSSFWLRFTLLNPEDTSVDRVLLFSYPRVRGVDLYVPSPENPLRYEVKHSGSNQPFHQREIPYRNYAFSIKVPPKKPLTCYMRIDSGDSLILPLTLYQPRAFTKYMLLDYVILGFYYGAMVIILIYNCLLFAGTRDQTYRDYSLMLACIILFSLTIDGSLSQFIAFHTPELENISRPFLLCLLVFLGLQFSRSFINIKELSPFLDNVVKVIMASAIAGLVISPFTPYFPTLQTSILFAFMALGFATIITLYGLWKRNRQSFFYAIAGFGFMLGGVTLILANFGILPYNLITTWGAFTGFLTQAVLLSLGLADRIKTLQKEALEAQKVAIDSLQRADQLKDEFLANTSHELRTPLNGIIGLSESMLFLNQFEKKDEVVQNLKMIIQSGKRLSSLVNDLLDFSKMKHQELMLQFKPVDIRSITDMVISILSPLLSHKQVKLHHTMQGLMPLVWGDENRVEQILMNLVGNAIKFTDEGSIMIQHQVISPFLVIHITDTGIGIPREKQKDIFKAFDQVDGSISRQYGGTGLGLSISRQLVEVLGGTLKVESEVNKGSTFTFTLLLATEEQKNNWKTIPGVPPPPQKELSLDSLLIPQIQLKEHNPDSGHRTILIVDDEPINVQVLKSHLSDLPFQIRVAWDGVEALQSIKAQLPDLILLDLMMPRMSGYEVCREIRKTMDPATMPILILTAKTQTEDMIEGLRAGANDYLTKPFNRDELIARIQTQIRFREAVDTLRESERLGMELKTAQTVQELLIPKQDPSLEELEIASYYSPAAETGGDWYSYRHHPENRTLDILIGDVTGHGVAAALITAMADSVYASVSEQRKRLKELHQPDSYLWHPTYYVEMLNNVLFTATRGLYNMTFFYSVIDLERNIMVFSSAGHPPCLIWRPGKFKILRKGIAVFQPFLEISIRSMYLGYEAGKHFDIQTQELESNDVIIWYTDGLVENSNADREPFGKRRLKQILQNCAGLTAHQIRDRIVEGVKAHCGAFPQEDDITLIVAKIN
ncbi:MAG: SpoIIE family protein phosphatase [SAR324 cluster bacterium]|nr:SpoIIE family protein phosphatase [SAR324 cluster bacterium]